MGTLASTARLKAPFLKGNKPFDSVPERVPSGKIKTLRLSAIRFFAATCKAIRPSSELARFTKTVFANQQYCPKMGRYFREAFAMKVVLLGKKEPRQYMSKLL
eukprot:Lithocolla_globosa_v1_NODE_6539_length_1071_cov_15.153543.p2 type:complete len:103 gc:universal NODE_6539_length_1071_cov_15.153543:302-610(+)